MVLILLHRLQRKLCTSLWNVQSIYRLINLPTSKILRLPCDLCPSLHVLFQNNNEGKYLDGSNFRRHIWHLLQHPRKYWCIIWKKVHGSLFRAAWSVQLIWTVGLHRTVIVSSIVRLIHALPRMEQLTGPVKCNLSHCKFFAWIIT